MKQNHKDCPLYPDPIKQFNQWYSLAIDNEINDPGAMALATCTKDAKPSVRMVLLKQADESGFKFHSNEKSQKGKEIAQNPFASLCFHWKSLRYQVRVSGKVEIIDEKEADEYFATRPYNRQIGAWASKQSDSVDSRELFEEQIKEFENKYPEDSEIPRPKYWVGYRLVPQEIEFWMDNPDRLHDRFLYKKTKDGKWDITRLYP